MKIRSLIITMLALTGAGALHAQRGRSVSCDKILNEKSVSSFVQRFSCARQAMLDGEDAQALELMAPIYKDATSSRSNTRVDSQAKLAGVVRLKIPAAADQLIGQYGADSVYAAVANASDINPLTGKATKGASKVVLPAELVTAVANAMGESRVPQAPPLTPEDLALLEEGVTPEEAAAIAAVTPAARQQAAQEVIEANIKAFAANSVLDEMFIAALDKGDQEVCQNLIAGMISGDILSSIKKAYTVPKGALQKSDAMYNSLRNDLTSWQVFGWFRARPVTMSSRELLGVWMDVVAAPSLIDGLTDSNVPAKQVVDAARNYLQGKSEGTSALRVSKAIMLARTAAKFIWEPMIIDGQAVRRATALEAEYAPVREIYDALIDGLIKNRLNISSDTMFKLAVYKYKFTGEIGEIISQDTEEKTLGQLDKYLGELIAIQMADVLMAKATPEQRRTWRDTAITAAKIGGVLAVVAALVYAGHTGYLGERAQKLATPVVTTFVAGMGYVGAAASNAASKGAAGAQYVGGKIAAAASYIPGSSYIASAAKSTANAVWGLGKQVVSSVAISGAVAAVSGLFGRMVGAAPAAAQEPVATPATAVQQLTELRELPRDVPEGFGEAGAGS